MDERVKNWLVEEQLIENGTIGSKYSIEYTRQIVSKQSKYQKIDIYETKNHGRLLQLDGVIQTCELDEFVYHEMISHIPLLTHPAPKNSLVIGGGDGGASREHLKHPLEQSYLIDIDEDVLKLSQEYLSGIGREFANERLFIKALDGAKFMRDNKACFDVVSIDSTDPVGPAAGLFSEQFYNDVYNALTDSGVMVCQSESPFYYPEFIKGLYNKLSNIFPITRIYTAVIPTYPGAYWTFMLASKQYDPIAISIEEIKERLHARKITDLKWLSANMYQAAFVLPPFLQGLIS